MLHRIVPSVLVILSLACSVEGTRDAGPHVRDAGPDARDARADAADASEGSSVPDASPDAPPDATWDVPDASAPDTPRPREAATVFFVGHSLVNFDMPAMLDGLARSAGVDHRYGAQIGIGAPLWWIWTHPDDAGGDDAHVELPTGRYDVLVLTELIPIGEHVMYSDTVEYASRFSALALAANPTTQVYVYETWYDITDPEWRANIEADRPIWEHVADELDARHEGPEVLLVPGGTALARLVERIEAGGVDGLSSRGDLFVDEIHLNDVGNYFIALVQLATIYRLSPVGLTSMTTSRYGVPYAAPSPEAARVMQEIAWEVVSRDPRAGVAAR